MENTRCNSALHEEIRRRSYLLWESEGRPEGRSAEHWQRAKADVEAEIERLCHAAAFAGETTAFVPPRLRISLPPSRRQALKIDHRKHERAA